MRPDYLHALIRRPGPRAFSAAAVLPLMMCGLLSAPSRAASLDPGTTYEQSDRQCVPAKGPLTAPGSKPIPIAESQLTGVKLAAGAQALGTEEQLASAGANLSKAARKYGNESSVAAGSVELLAWAGSSGAPRAALNRALEAAGYKRTEYDTLKSDNNRITFFKLVNSRRENETLFGMWVEDGKALLVAWGRLGAQEQSASAKETGEGDSRPQERRAPTDEQVRRPARPAGENAATGGAITLRVDSRTNAINVMGKTMPTIPSFPTATRKPNTVCGYVYDAHGKPVRGAVIGVRSTAVGGFYSGASGKSDAKGYYEVQAPWGVAHFYCAGAVIDYGDGIAAMGLHPEDGETGNFVPTQGEVKNFVLLSYGVADRAAAQDNPQYAGNYYGGSVSLGWRVEDGSPSALPANAEIELTLTPDGPLADGSRGRPIVIRKQAGTMILGQLYINNIPVGTYKLTAKLASGGALHIKETGPYGNRPFGLDPKEVDGEAKLSFRPGSAKADMAIAGHGNWERIDITLTKP